MTLHITAKHFCGLLNATYFMYACLFSNIKKKRGRWNAWVYGMFLLLAGDVFSGFLRQEPHI